LKTVQLLQSALADVRGEKAYYRKLDPALAQRFARAVQSAIVALAQQPLAMQIIDFEIRRWPVNDGFPHGIMYRVMAAEILVLSIFHPRQHPLRWQGRS